MASNSRLKFSPGGVAHITGFAELQKQLEEFPVKLEKSVMRGALRAGQKVIMQEAVERVPEYTGELRKTIRISTRIRKGRVTAVVSVGSKKAWYAHLVEFGTARHFIKAKGKGWLSFGGIFAKKVTHPGTKPQPFMRPALDVGGPRAIVAVGEYLRKRIGKEQKKLGIDPDGFDPVELPGGQT